MKSVIQTLNFLVQEALIKSLGPEYAQADPMIRPSANARFGDYQINAAMSLAKSLGKNPRELASLILKELEENESFEKCEIAGPGFINLTLNSRFLSSALLDLSEDLEKTSSSEKQKNKTVVLDYSSPNVAKEMHVGHLRSTNIGDAIARILEFSGYTVIRQNHLGDWGTQFGMLIEYISDLGWTADSAHSISDLNQLYKDAKARFDAEEKFAERARNRVVLLQSGETKTLELWKLLIAESKEHFAQVYERLGVLLREEDYCGESFYNPLLTKAVEDLISLGLAQESNGAICAFPQGFNGPDGKPSPLILRKSDGGYGYDTTDMAAIRYRINELNGDRLIYVTDSRQRQHFAMIFQTAKEAGWLTESVLAEHVFFGSILGEDGKPFKSRSGDTVKLADLLEEAVSRALELLEQKNPELPAEEKKEIARAIGIGAVKYADLSNDKVKDYVFSWDRMLAFDGNTAPYLQNAYVRIRSILRKSQETGVQEAQILEEALIQKKPLPQFALVLEHESEKALGLKALQFPEVLESVSTSLEPHRLSNWLYDLATAYHHFYENCPVIKAEESQRTSRLFLSSLCARLLEQGLELLGIKTPSRM